MQTCGNNTNNLYDNNRNIHTVNNNKVALKKTTTDHISCLGIKKKNQLTNKAQKQKPNKQTNKKLWGFSVSCLLSIPTTPKRSVF